jgi:uncharacterized protein YndB with AHSA1/START domain
MSMVLERTYRAQIDEVWDLWTTKEGFESWWGPQGFRVEVFKFEAKVGGAVHYDMIADAPEAIAAMKQMGQPLKHETRGHFAEIVQHKRITLKHVIDFLPGVKPYESTIVVDFAVEGKSVKMTTTLLPMHDETFTQMQIEGYTSQLTKLDKRFSR